MQLVLIAINMSLQEYNSMSEDDLNRFARLYSGRVKTIILDDTSAKLVIEAPSTWRNILLNNLMLPYRFA